MRRYRQAMVAAQPFYGDQVKRVPALTASLISLLMADHRRRSENSKARVIGRRTGTFSAMA